MCVCSHLCLPLSLRIAPWPRCGSSFRCGCFASSSPSPCSLLGRLGETSRGRVSAIVCSSAARPSRWTRLNTVATISFHNLLFSYKFHFHYPSETNKMHSLSGRLQEMLQWQIHMYMYTYNKACTAQRFQTWLHYIYSTLRIIIVYNIIYILCIIRCVYNSYSVATCVCAAVAGLFAAAAAAAAAASTGTRRETAGKACHRHGDVQTSQTLPFSGLKQTRGHPLTR